MLRILKFNIPILPEAFLTFASKSSIGPSYSALNLILNVHSMLWSENIAQHTKDIAQHTEDVLQYT